MHRIKMMLLVVTLVILTGLMEPTPIHAADPELAGIYTVEGKNPDGKTYTGSVEVIAHDQRYEVTWTLAGPSGDTEVSGIGILVDGRFSVAFFVGAPAIAVYTIEDKNPLTLKGKWAVPSAQGIHTENLVKIPKGSKPLPRPTHQL